MSGIYKWFLRTDDYSKKVYAFLYATFFNVSAFKLPVQSKTSLLPVFLWTGNKETRLK